jgi:hypothetical protein
MNSIEKHYEEKLQSIQNRWDLLKLYLEASKEECLYSPHEIATLQDVICKMDELEEKCK